MMRASGILMPVSALPSEYGIGSLGLEAFKFIDFLEAAGQRFWQVLPLGPTGYGDSPYQSFSVFAVNPYFIDLDMLAQDGFLSGEELAEGRVSGDGQQIDYLALFEHRFSVLKKAAARLSAADAGFAEFEQEQSAWLEDYALFMALKEENGHIAFSEWGEELRMRAPEAIARARERLGGECRFWRATQYFFHIQWARLKKYANAHGVMLVGDIPIYASQDSADFWASPELFQAGEDRRLERVAGCPPDAFSPDGQLWGNPLYAWERHRESGYEWWLRRLEYLGKLCDVIRIDHFRGFAGYYSIPAEDENARGGEWQPGPGMDFIGRIKERLPQLSIIAEDLGFLDFAVFELLKESGFPGMKVLQFAFDSREASDYLPHNYSKNSVVYTGTHDNTTLADWEKTAPAGDVAFAKEYLSVGSEESLPEAIIRAAESSVCDLAVVPMADWLGLGAEGRINKPSTVGGNWVWRMKDGTLSPELAARIRRMTKIYGRI